ncbi:hypothetical protein BU17DRAFT_72605 [Hysterangium stoloniferum]|nr:hypothetical protein BU17DRAFT_72605 [Hysterangium stoloniferum]
MENIEKNWSIVRPRDGSPKYPKTKIEQLPYDIQLSIFNALQVEDAVSFAITCWVMWDALPEAMETEELAEVSEAEGLYSWIREFEDWDEGNGIFPPAAMVTGSHDWRIFQEIVDEKSPLVRVIRNMSKKEYIRESRITAEAGLDEMRHPPWYWAGDRIDIMCENRHDAVLMAESKDPSKAPWKDVTEAKFSFAPHITGLKALTGELQSGMMVKVDTGSSPTTIVACQVLLKTVRGSGQG